MACPIGTPIEEETDPLCERLVSVRLLLLVVRTMSVGPVRLVTYCSLLALDIDEGDL